MRILSLQFKNLNSLVGAWNIDFMHPAYEDSGIFAITGPTGAGKSTLLDAISLALYGQTPRLGRITKSENEIMSRQTAECFAELHFRTAKGDFKVVWGQHRARRRVEGELQNPTHTLYDLNNNCIVADQLSLVPKEIERVTGLDFDRFTRSMLLAQGRFSAFLQAKPDERSPLLEQITGTEIYSHISMQTHERHSVERQLLANLKAEVAQVQLLSSDQEQQLQAELIQQKKQLTEQQAQLEVLSRIKQHLQKKAELDQQAIQIKEQADALAQQASDFAPQAQRLARAEKAQPLKADFMLLEHHQTTQRQLQLDIIDKQEELPKQQAELTHCKEQLQQHQQTTDQLGVQFEQEQQRWQQVHAIDQTIAHLQQRYAQAKDTLQTATRQEQVQLEALKSLRQAQTDAAIQREKSHHYLTTHVSDEQLAHDLGLIEAEFKQSKEIEQKQLSVTTELNQAKADEHEAVLALQAPTADLAAHALDREVLITQEQAAQTLLQQQLAGKTLSEWREHVQQLTESRYLLLQQKQKLVDLQVQQQQQHKLQNELKALTKKQAQHVEQLAQQNQLISTLETRQQLLIDQQRLQQQIADLEQQRLQLIEGEPCPLCGALSHPFSVEHPESSEKSSELNTCIEQLKAALVIQAELVKAEASTTALMGQKQQLIDELLNNSEQARHQLTQELITFELELSDEASTLLAVDVQLEAWQSKGKINQQRISDCEKTLALIESLAQQRNGLEQRMSALKTDCEQLTTKQMVAKALQQQLSTELNGLVQRHSALHQQRITRLQPYQPVDETNWLLELKQRMTAWQQAQTDQAHWERDLAIKTSQMQQHEDQLKQLGLQLADYEAAVIVAEEKLNQHQKERYELFADQVVSEQEKAWRLRVQQQQAQHKIAADNYQAAQQRVIRSEQLLLDLAQRVESVKQTIENAQLALTQRKLALGFTELQQLQAAFMEDAALNTLRQQAQHLDMKKAALQTRESMWFEQLTAWQQHPAPTETIAQCVEGIEQLENNVDALRHSAIHLQHRYELNEKNKTSHLVQLEQIERQELEYRKWAQLHQLIGSADGKKFRNFAQGLTFELMVMQANQQLMKMSDRYLLSRHPTEPLELNVIDNYQAGEIRPTKNISGGESFIISLALALGLAQMASDKVRIDSLFLDEGFGTLDDDALDVALETLATLQQEGKLIGIISHVAALKERIATQIQVESKAFGRSLISGPGCVSLI